MGSFRRPRDETPESLLASGAIKIYPERFEVFVESQRVHLTLTQFRMLSLMASRPGWVFTPDQIRRSLDMSRTGDPSAAIKNHVYAIRRKLGRAGRQIETVRGVGYRINDHTSKAALDG